MLSDEISLPPPMLFVHLLSDLTLNNPSSGDWFHYRQLTSFYHHIESKAQLHRQLSPFELLCTQETYPTKVVSLVYGILRKELTSHASPPFQRKLELDLGHSTSTEEWKKMHALTHKSSISGYTQEKNYKVLSRWYRTPDVLRKNV